MVKKNASLIRSRRRRRQAFTLVEIMIVVLIISVILNMAVPSFVQARNNTQTKACIENLRHIQDAKDEWSIVSKEPGSATPQWSDLAPYMQLGGASQLYCPTAGAPNGIYYINSVDSDPVCSAYGGNPVGTGPHSYDGD